MSERSERRPARRASRSEPAGDGVRGRSPRAVDGMTSRRVVEALVFDLDGTIADTESVEYDAIRLVWADHGLDYPIER